MRLPALVVLVVLAVAGCGDDAPDPPPRAVELTLTAPADAATVDAERVTVAGRVSPAAASVEVAGRRAEVTAGAFSAEVPLEEGANVVDVSAAAPGRRPSTTAVRVVREVPVVVPDLVGEEAEAAIAELEQLGLETETARGGGLLDDLLPGAPEVCALDPAPGTRVKRGSTVTVELARNC